MFGKVVDPPLAVDPYIFGLQLISATMSSKHNTADWIREQTLAPGQHPGATVLTFNLQSNPTRFT